MLRSDRDYTAKVLAARRKPKPKAGHIEPTAPAPSQDKPTTEPLEKSSLQVDEVQTEHDDTTGS